MGDTLTHYASYKGHKKLLEYLIKKNADLKIPNTVIMNLF